MFRILDKIPTNISYGEAISTGHDIIYVSRKMRYNRNIENNCKYIWHYPKNIGKWKTLMILPTQNFLIPNSSSNSICWSFYHHHLTLNVDLDKLYISLGIWGILIIDLKDKSMIKIPMKNPNFKHFIKLNENKRMYRPFPIDDVRIICCKSGELHFVGQSMFIGLSMHIERSRELGELYTYFNIIHHWNNITNTQIIYVLSQNIMLLIGGGNRNWYCNKNRFNGIWKYEFSIARWSKIKNLSLNLYGHSAILTSNEKYIVIAGGYLNKIISNNIYILNISNPEKYILTQTIISSPFPNKLYTLQYTGGIKDVLLISGWIRNILKEVLFSNSTMVFNGIYFPILLSRNYTLFSF